MYQLIASILPSLPELASALPVIGALIIIEGLLSVDNALAIAAMASHLPGKQKELALKLGIIGAYLFRGLSLWAASWIIKTPAVMWVGAFYLLYLMSDHFVGSGGDADGDGEQDGLKGKGLVGTIVAIEVIDLSLSVDNVVAAAALDKRLWVVCTGVFIGILALRFVAGACIKLIEKFPILEHAAFLLIGFVGFILVGELIMDYRTPGHHHHIGSGWKFVSIAAILALSILYSQKPAVQAIFKPLIKASHVPMKLVSVVVGGIVGVVLWPFKALIGAIKGKSAAAVETPKE